MKHLFIVLILGFVLNFSLMAQVGINTDGSSPDASAMLDVKSTIGGMLLPRMTAAQRDAISNPANGLMVFVTDDSTFYYYRNSVWEKVGQGASYWETNGNTIFTDSTRKVVIGSNSTSGTFSVITDKSTDTYTTDRCTGGTASASESYAGQPAANAFDDATASYWSNNGNLPVWLQYDFGNGNGKVIARYRLYYEGAGYDASPNDWTLEASDDGSSWTTLDTQIEQGWTANQWKEYTFSNTARYRYYRINISDNTGTATNFVSINEMEMMELIYNDHPSLFVGSDNNVGIGTSSPAASLDVNGSFRLADGNESDGFILTTDAAGNASWASGDTLNAGGWVTATDYNYTQKGTTVVGAGSYSVSSKLYVKNTDKEHSAYLYTPNNSDAAIYSLFNRILGSGSGAHFGIYNEVTGIGTGNQYGNFTMVSNAANGSHYGAAIALSGNGTGTHYGTSTDLLGTGTGVQYGDYIYIRNSGNNQHTGTLNELDGVGSGIHYGMENILSGTGTGQQYGSKKSITNSGNASHYGDYNYLNGEGSGSHYGTYNDLSGTGTGDQYGSRKYITNSGDATHYGDYNNLDGGGSGEHFGNYNLLSGVGAGVQYGNYVEISNSGSGWHHGFKVALNGSGVGIHYGFNAELSGTGIGTQIGSRKYITNSGDGVHYGDHNNVSGDGSGAHYGNYSHLGGAGTGEQYGNYQGIINSGNNIHYGNYNYLTGSGSGMHYGSMSELVGTGTGIQYGSYTTISNSNDNYHYGYYTNLSGGGSGLHFGTYNALSGTGTGNQYGSYTTISNSGNAIHYGDYTYLSGSGTGYKYGVYSSVSATAGGTHYAIYGNATKSGSYAGYFNGDVSISEKLIKPISGDADLKIYVYGSLSLTTGNAYAAESSTGFTSVKTATGVYKVTFSSYNTDRNYLVLANALKTTEPIILTYEKLTGSFIVRAWDLSGNLVDTYLNFIVIKK